MTSAPSYDERRPTGNLMTLYVIRALLTGPIVVIYLPFLFFRYKTLRYRFDAEGISMSWGFLFRREVNLTYARIQDIQIMSGPLMRWLGLAELHIQTASGSAAAEMVIEGLKEFQELRDFLYGRMRGSKTSATRSTAPTSAPDGNEVPALLNQIAADIRATRVALEDRAGGDHA